MTATYNEIDEYASRWISNLIDADHIAPGNVDTRSITELTAEDVRHVTQAHFFAGIAVWSAAARAAGWPDNAPLWSGSCPCQPFSQAGRGAGVADERHLWPQWFQLIRECRPPIVVGEQVASPAGLGWIDAVFADLEGANYACAAIDFGAASVGAPHQRQRLYFVAISDGQRLEELRVQLQERRSRSNLPQVGGRSTVGDMADDKVIGWQERRYSPSQERTRSIDNCAPRGPTRGFWSDAEWIPCRDGKNRPAQPGTFPLAHGVAGRVGRLRAYGNAIVLPQAQAFLETVIELLTNEHAT